MINHRRKKICYAFILIYLFIIHFNCKFDNTRNFNINKYVITNFYNRDKKCYLIHFLTFISKNLKKKCKEHDW